MACGDDAEYGIYIKIWNNLPVSLSKPREQVWLPPWCFQTNVRVNKRHLAWDSATGFNNTFSLKFVWMMVFLMLYNNSKRMLSDFWISNIFESLCIHAVCTLVYCKIRHFIASDEVRSRGLNFKWATVLHKSITLTAVWLVWGQRKGKISSFKGQKIEVRGKDGRVGRMIVLKVVWAAHLTRKCVIDTLIRISKESWLKIMRRQYICSIYLRSQYPYVKTLYIFKP